MYIAGEAASLSAGGFGGGDRMSGLGASLNKNIDWKLNELPKFEKNFYVEHPDITKRDQREVDAFYKKNEVVLQGSDIPKPVMTFEESPFPEYVLKTELRKSKILINRNCINRC